jgi:adenylate cyclase
LGRSDFRPVSNSLYNEFEKLTGKMSVDEWNRKQINFISGHKYYTNTAKKLRQVKKEKQLNGLRDLDNDPA